MQKDDLSNQTMDLICFKNLLSILRMSHSLNFYVCQIGGLDVDTECSKCLVRDARW